MFAVIVPDLGSAEYLLGHVTLISTKQMGDMFFYTAALGSFRFLLIISGYGKVNISSAITLANTDAPLSALLGIGTAGSLDSAEAGMCHAVISSSTLQYDVDFTMLGEKFVTLPKMKKGIFGADEQMIRLAVDAAEKENVRCHVGRIVTDDRFVADSRMAASLRRDYGGLAVDAECGSMGQLAYLLKIPFVAIKVISNDASCCAAAQNQENHHKAGVLVQKIALAYLRQLSI